MRVLALGGLALALAVTGASSSAAPARPVLAIHVAGNHFVDGRGRTIRLLGVNRSSFEFACSSGYALYEGPVDAKAISFTHIFV